MNDLATIARWLDDTDALGTFSGAGLSKAFGIPTYRDAAGLWKEDGHLGFSRRWRCDACGTRDLAPLMACPGRGAPTWPDVVMFGETLDGATLAAAELAARRSRVCRVVGTAGVVYPAAGLVAKAKSRGARVTSTGSAGWRRTPA